MLPYLITKNGRNIHLKDKYIQRDVKFGDKDVPLSKCAVNIMFLNEKLISKLVIYHVSFLKLRMF